MRLNSDLMGMAALLAVFVFSIFIHEQIHAYIFDCYGASDVRIDWLPWPVCQGKVAPAQVADMDGWQKANEFGSTLFWVGLAFTRKP